MEKTTGDFKTKEKFIEFIGARGNINFISKEAMIQGEMLSGLGLENSSFKLTIYDDGTVDFDDVDGQNTSKEKRENLLNIILEKTITPFRKRMVVKEITFTSIQEVKGEKIPLYLAVEYTKPIEKLSSLFDEEVEVSQNQMNKLDEIMSLFDDIIDEGIDEYVEEELVESVEEVKDVMPFANQMKEQFDKLKQEKLESLKSELKLAKENLNKFEKDKAFAESKVIESKSEIRLLESRIDSLNPTIESNGIYFNVSERLNEKIVLDEEIYNTIKSKVDSVKQINSEAFMKLFEDGEFRIKLAKKNQNEFEEINDFKDIEDLITTDIPLSIKEDGLYYVGDLVWAELVNKFIKMGFSQDPEWDKLCNSNSYRLHEDDI